MISRPPRFLAPLLAISLVPLAACGGGNPSPPTGPAPVVVTPPAGGGSAAPAVTKPGPNITPEGVVFNFKSEIKGSRIYLAGNFNGWTPSDDKFLMKDDDGDQTYSITVKLGPGVYQYKYVID